MTSSSERSRVHWWVAAIFLAGYLVFYFGTLALGAPRTDAAGIHLRVLGIPAGTIRFADIESIHAEAYIGMSAGGNPLRTLRVGSCPSVVTIQRRSGWFNRIVACARDPEAFVRQVEAMGRS